MRIVFDNIVYALQKAGGISVVWSNLIKRIAASHENVLFLEYPNHNISRKAINLPIDKTKPLTGKNIYFKRYLDPNVKENKPFIFHSSYFRISNNPNAINVTTVHDFTYELYVKNPLKRWLHCWQKHHAIWKSDYVVCISENTKADLLRFLPGFPEERIKVIYNGIDRNIFYPTKDRHTEDYALFVGNRDPYKNFDKIIDPLCRLSLTLKIVGAPLNDTEVKMLKHHKCRYKYIGRVNDDTLNQLYNNAFCLLYPSEYEGFGLPVLEAQSAGCPVIAFNGSSTKEIIGNTPLLLQTTSSDEIMSKISMLNDPVIRHSIVTEGMANAALYSWDKMATEYDLLYKEIEETNAKNHKRHS